MREGDSIVKVSVFCLSSLRNKVKKLFYVQFFTNLIHFFYLILTLPKCTSFVVFFLKDYCWFQTKNNFHWHPILKKIMHLRFWSNGADFRTEAQKFFHVRTIYTT